MSLRTCLAPLVLLLAAVGCSVPQAAIPDAAPGTSEPPSTPAPSSAPATGLASLEACDLLTAQEAGSLGLPAQGAPDEIAGLRRCDWNPPGLGNVSTTIDESGGVGELVLDDASSVTDVTIGRYQAKRALETSGPGYCGIYFAVGDTATASVLALYLDDTPKACEVADRAAALIEPKLP